MSTQRNSTCSGRLFICLTVVFLITTIVLLAVLIWRELREEEEEPLGTLVQKRYPGYFRTLEEQRAIEEKLRQKAALGNNTVLNYTFTSGRPCSVNCNSESFSTPFPGRKRRNVGGQQFHGCCVSSTVFESPSQQVNIYGTQRKFVQLDSMRQYFLVHECSQAIGCTGGVCEYDDTIYTAVVHKHGVTDPDDIDHIEIDWFYFHGCCKSINT